MFAIGRGKVEKVTVEYAGPVADFRSLLVIGSLIHVGKKTVFGNGQFVVE